MSIFFKSIFLFLLGNCFNLPGKKKGITLRIETEPGKWLHKDVIEFIEEGRVKMSKNYENSTIHKNAIMVMGFSGTGKSTLINYLNGIPLVGKEIKGEWVIDLESQNVSLPGGFKIGHSKKSETMYAAVYSPVNKDFTYIDNPGFHDTRGIGFAIANGFFRKLITDEVINIKFLLLITHFDLQNRGQQFRDSIKAFSDFLGIFDGENTRQLSKSIGIIITRLKKDPKYNVSQVKAFIKDVMLEIIEEESSIDHLIDNEYNTFKQIINDDQIEIFSSPTSSERISSVESDRILTMIDSLKYIQRTDAKIRVTIDKKYISQLIEYVVDRYKDFESYLQITLDKSVSNYFTDVRRQFKNAKEAAFVYEELNRLVTKRNEKSYFKIFLNSFNDSIINKSVKQDILTKKEVLDYFVELLPRNNQNAFPDENQWWMKINTTLLLNFMNNLTQYLQEKVSNFQNFAESNFEEYLKTYYVKKLKQLTCLDGLTKLQSSLNELNSNIIAGNYDIMSLIDKFSAEIIDHEEKEKFRVKKSELDHFNNLLSSEQKVNLSDSWVKTLKYQISSKIDAFVIETKKYYNDEKAIYDSLTGRFTYKGFFTKMSTVLAILKQTAKFDSLKSVNVYTTNSFKFDSNFILNISNSSPAIDILIISPHVEIEDKVVVDLSCYSVPGYPDDTEKAQNGISDSENGHDGKPGLPGCTGGSLVILADSIINFNTLSFISSGGQGGPGQHGKPPLNIIFI